MVSSEIDEVSAEFMARLAAGGAKENFPRLSGNALADLHPVWGTGFFGVGWTLDYVWFQEQGIKPFTMHALAGKIIPMWVEDPDGKIAAKEVPDKDLAKRTKVALDGRKLTQVFRKASLRGERKNVMRKGRLVSVPRSYPGAPGRISRRIPGRPAEPPEGRLGGQIAQGNVGVRWRHPGLSTKGLIAGAVAHEARSNGIGGNLYAMGDGIKKEL